ncbi:FadR/GntR family transcriptional regulator [Hyphomicrobium sp.]|uniref:FadR/GntR family transcriptional regulator n=1 Tax=Hyphomicrobium sp. TaxID=82 RepID=UPI002D79BE3C|nr:GntR family transcriptional regulator [Hyphomicrobium sp.]HET6390289.1 GntR family transcriptional regulator [Hyphomicrobium sp.]
MSDTYDFEAPPWIDDVTRHPLVTPRVKEIATRLFARCASGEYPFGTRIPAERDLASEFGDSRAAIRQALDFLTAYGIVARRAGSGTFVSYQRKRPAGDGRNERASSHVDIDQLAETASPFALNIASSVLAPEMTRLATIYMTTRDIADLQNQLTRLEAIVTESATFAMLEEQFMMAIARGTHNSLIVAMYGIVHEVRRHPQWAASRQQALTPAKIKSIQLMFRSLYDAIERRNVETAVEIIKLYVANAHEDMIYES